VVPLKLVAVAEGEEGEGGEELLPPPRAHKQALVEEQAAVWKSMVAQEVEVATMSKSVLKHPWWSRNKTQTGGATSGSGSGSGSGSAACLAHVAAAPPTTAPPTAAAPTRPPKRPEDAALTPVETGDCHEAALLRCSSSSACFLARACRSLQVSFLAPPAAALALERGGG